MRILKLSAAFAAFCLSASAAMAADVGYNYGGEPAYAPPVLMDWNGYYVGAHLGFGFGSTDIADPDGVLGGVQVGGNWQFQQVVVGLEGDFSGAGISADGFDGEEFSVGWLATVRGRIGWAFDRFMVYGTGGLAWASANYDDGPTSDEVTHMGWAAGAGIEAMVTENISAKAEYLFMALGEEDYSVGPIDLDIHTIRLGVNYHF